jgi:RNA polymerase sigma factor (sigma-70 family)
MSIPAAATWADEMESRYLAYYDEAVRWAAAITGDLDSGRDAAHDAFVQLFGRVRPLRAPESFRFYLHRTVINAALARLRSEQRDRARSEKATRAARTVASNSDDVVMSELLNLLPPKQRAVLILRYVLDMSEAETARLLSCRPGTVKSSAARALARLREDLSHG